MPATSSSINGLSRTLILQPGNDTTCPARLATLPTIRSCTMLSKLETNGQVAHRVEGRVNVYRSKLPREKVGRSMVSDLAQRLCAGDITQLVCHLLDECNVSREELTALKKLIRQKEQELNDDQ